jgi:hypothetical protein
MDVDVENVFFTHARIRPFFSGCGRRLEDTLKSLEEGSMKLEDLPQITILATPTSQDDGQYFSLNNRRLWVLRQLRSRGALEGRNNLVHVRVKDALPRELDKYAKDGIDRKASATIMGGGDKGGEGDDEDGDIDGDGDGGGGSGDDGKGGTDTNGGQKTATGKKKKGGVPSVPALSAEAKNQLKAVKKRLAKGKGGGKKAEILLSSAVDELIAAGVLLVEQEGLARAELAA